MSDRRLYRRGRSRPDPRPGRSRARLFRLLPALALLLGMFGLFAAAPAQAQVTPKISIDSLQILENGQAATITPEVNTGTYQYKVKVTPNVDTLSVKAAWTTKAGGDHIPPNPKPWLKSVTYNNLSNGAGGLKTEKFTVCYKARAAASAKVYWSHTRRSIAQGGSPLYSGGAPLETGSNTGEPYLVVMIEHEVWFSYWLHGGVAPGQELAANRASRKVLGSTATNCPDIMTEVENGIIVIKAGDRTPILEDAFDTNRYRYTFELDRTLPPADAADLAPLPPTGVSVDVSASRKSAQITWTQVEMGRQAPTSYEVQYRNFRKAAEWIDAGHSGTDRTHTIDLVESLRSHWCSEETGWGYYEMNLRVRATNDNGTGEWSRIAGRTVTRPAINCMSTNGQGVDGSSAQQVAGAGGGPYAALIAQMKEWRNDPQWAHRWSHTSRWDRALLAFGETVADSTLTAMTAAEAQAWADSGLTRWVEVAAALREIESGVGRIPAPPVVTIAAGEAVTEGTAAGFTLTAGPTPASDLDVTVTVGQEGSFLHASTLGAHTVTIPSGFTSASFTVLTVDDATHEPDGSVTAALGAGTGYTVGDAASASVAVADDDGAQHQVQGAGQQDQPPAQGHGALIAKMREWRDDPQWSSFKSHTDRWDRALLALGETVLDTTVTPMTAAEAQALADSGLTRWVEVAEALWELEGDDDTPAQETLPAILTDRGIAREWTDDAVAFTVRLDRAASGPVTVDYATADGNGVWASTAPATAGADYTATSGTLTFAAGETWKSVLVFIINDEEDEGSEYFLLRFSNPQGADLEAGHRETQGVIRNGEPPQPAAADPPQALHAALIGQMNDWRNDPQWAHQNSHTERWDRALLAFGEPVSDTSLTAMTDSEAQRWADDGLSRWVGVAAALRDVVTGSGSLDTLSGTSNGELLVGLGGADDLSAQGGNDELRGGNGDDDLTGGAGQDRFVFFAGETGANAITDFASGDVIVLMGSGWRSVRDIIDTTQAVGTGNLIYTLVSGLTVETTDTLRAEDFVLEE